MRYTWEGKLTIARSNRENERLFMHLEQLVKIDNRYAIDREEQMRDRIVQLLYRFSNKNYISKLKKINAGEKITPINSHFINIHENKIEVTLRAIVILVGYFFLQWAISLFAIFGFGKKIVDGKNINLLFGIGDADARRDQGESILSFFSEGPIEGLRNGSTYIVQNNFGSAIGFQRHSKQIIFTKRPLHECIRSSKLGFMVRLRAIKKHIKYLLLFLASVVQNPVTVFLCRDYAVQSLADVLEETKTVSNVYITNSMFMEQPVWMRRKSCRSFSVEMIWYSQNSIPVVLKGESDHTAQPAMARISVDHHWVWTEDFKHLNCHRGKSTPVGPILWYLDQKKESTPEKIKILVFTVTPVVDEYFENEGYVKSHINFDYMKKFLSDIVTSCEDIGISSYNIEINIKEKRNYSSIHDNRYIEFLSEIEQKKKVNLIRRDGNIYNFVRQCDFVIGVPFTSAVLVGDHLRKPSIYYDPTETILPIYDSGKAIQFVSGKEELKKQLRQYCEKRANDRLQDNDI